MLYFVRLFVAVTYLSLAACGGGGGSGDRNPQPELPVSNEPPVAMFSIDRLSGNAPLTIVTDASASSDADGSVVQFAWDFNGQDAVGVTAQHTFSDPGDYTVTLRVTDNDGASASRSAQVQATQSSGTGSLSGTIRILGSTSVDADVNDRLTIAQNNNSIDAAQPVPNPVTLGGFANIAGAGESTGNLFASGDPGDFYRIDLAGGEVISLSIADPSADLDLLLWDDDRNLVDAAVGFSQLESIEVAQGGSYFIEVEPFSGASNYVLYVGVDLNASGVNRNRTAARLTDPIVPGRVIVKLADKPSGQARVPPGLQRLAWQNGSPQGRGPALYRVMNPPNLKLPAGGIVSPQQRAQLRTLMALKRLQRDPSVAYAEADTLWYAHATPNDAFYPAQWHYESVNLPLAWDTTTGSTQVIAAVIDTGVLLNHPDLAAQLVDGYDFISDPVRARDGDGLDDDPNDPGDLAFGSTSSFHGTHVAGTVAAQSDNGQGVAGAAWQTRIMPLRVLGRDGGSSFDVLQAVRYAAGLSNNANTGPTQIADVINLSLGSNVSSQSAQDTFDEVRQAGVMVVASAGNDATSLPAYPAAYAGVIGVAATTIANARAGYSNFGSYVDIAAPGGSNATDLNGDGIPDGVISTSGDDSTATVEFTYAAQSGTSMAAPHVTGIISLMKAIHPGMTPAEFDTALMAGDLTDDLGSSGRDDQFGYGLINARKAVRAAELMATGQGTDPGPVLSVLPRTLNFGGFIERLETEVRNAGSGMPTVDDVSVDVPWLSVASPAAGDGLGVYEISVERSGLSEGAYQGTVSFSSSTAGVVKVGVIMQVSSQAQQANAGLIYVLLVDLNNDSVVPAVRVNAVAGEYAYQMLNVPPGEYRLFAGTDADDDSFLCDAGESCGAYPTLDVPAVIAVNGDLGEIDFETAFRLNLSSSATRDGATSSGGLPLNKPATPAGDHSHE